MDGEARSRIVDQLRAMFPVGSSGSGFRISDFREEAEQVVLVGHYKKDPHLFGIPLNWERTPHGFFYTDDWVLSEAEWIDSVDIGLQVLLDTSLLVGARRRKVDDYIELVEQDWPKSPIYVQEMDPPDGSSYLEHLGWDFSVGRQHRRDGTGLAWIYGYWNTASSETICQAVIARGSDASTGEVVLIDALPGTPVIAVVDVLWQAAHLAAWKGVSVITTDDTNPELDIIGFRPGQSGLRTLETSFLELDMAAYGALIETEAAAGKWNTDDFVNWQTRDEEGPFPNPFG